MHSYLDLVEEVLDTGVRKPNRTGVDTISCFAKCWRHSLSSGFPLLTTKKMSFDSIAAELLWFLSGDSSVTQLNKKTGIWKPWADENDEVPYAYGEYWRRYPLYPSNGALPVSAIGGALTIDQLRGAIDTLKKSPNSRRAVVVAWDPRRAPQSSLPPCHYTFVMGVWDGKLSLHVTMRSADLGVGVPYNIASYALLTHLIAKELGLALGCLAITMVDCHIYVCGEKDAGADELLLGEPRRSYDHVDMLRSQVSRLPRQLPELEVTAASIDEAVERAYDNQNPIRDIFKLTGYDPCPAIPLRVAV